MRTSPGSFALTLLLAATAHAEVPRTTLDPWAGELDTMADEALDESSGSTRQAPPPADDGEPAMANAGRGRATEADGTAALEIGGAAADDGPCTPATVVVSRFGTHPIESVRVPLSCDGGVDSRAVDALSWVARPRGDAAPRTLSSGVVERLQRVARRFPDREIVIVSGYRPNARRGSRHRSAHALDLRVDGVPNEELRDFLLQLPETGVGYYPNSTFVHVDERPSAAYWVDRSGPGEPPDYARVAAREPRTTRGGAHPTSATVDVDDMVRAALAEAARTLASLEDEVELPVPESPPAAPAAPPVSAPQQATGGSVTDAAADPDDAGAEASAPVSEAPAAEMPEVLELPPVFELPAPPEPMAETGEESGPEAQPPSTESGQPEAGPDAIASASAADAEAEPPSASEAPTTANDTAAGGVAASEAAVDATPPMPEASDDTEVYDPAELRALSDAALFRMNDAFGRGTALSKALPTKPQD